MTKNIGCVLCHTTVNGDISGFGTVVMRNDSTGLINGNLFAPDFKLQYWTAPSGVYVLDQSVVDTISNPQLIATTLPSLISFNLDGTPGAYTVKHGEIHNPSLTDVGGIPTLTNTNITFSASSGLYTLTNNSPAIQQVARQNLPVNAAGAPIVDPTTDFPNINPLQCKTRVSGTIQFSNGGVLTSPYNGNLIAVNGALVSINPSTPPPADTYNGSSTNCTAANTIVVNGEFVVDGDLVIAGCIKGKGTLYSSGSIYVPDDIRMTRSAFPFAAGGSDAVQKASDPTIDMLSLGASKFIVIGDLAENESVALNPESDPVFRNNSADYLHLYTWLPESIYTTAFLKRAFNISGCGVGRGAVSLVEANLYANWGVASQLVHNSKSNIVLNGSVISPALVLLASGWSSSSSVNPFNGVSFLQSEISQDYRLKFSELGYECERTH